MSQPAFVQPVASWSIGSHSEQQLDEHSVHGGEAGEGGTGGGAGEGGTAGPHKLPPAMAPRWPSEQFTNVHESLHGSASSKYFSKPCTNGQLAVFQEAPPPQLMPSQKRLHRCTRSPA